MGPAHWIMIIHMENAPMRSDCMTPTVWGVEQTTSLAPPTPMSPYPMGFTPIRMDWIVGLKSYKSDAF